MKKEKSNLLDKIVDISTSVLFVLLIIAAGVMVAWGIKTAIDLACDKCHRPIKTKTFPCLIASGSSKHQTMDVWSSGYQAGWIDDIPIKVANPPSPHEKFTYVTMNDFYRRPISTIGFSTSTVSLTEMDGTFHEYTLKDGYELKFAYSNCKEIVTTKNESSYVEADKSEN